MATALWNDKGPIFNAFHDRNCYIFFSYIVSPGNFFLYIYHRKMKEYSLLFLMMQVGLFDVINVKQNLATVSKFHTVEVFYCKSAWYAVKESIVNTEVDSDEGGRQSKMAANSKSHAVSQMVLEMVCSVEGLSQ